jgi:amidase
MPGADPITTVIGPLSVSLWAIKHFTSAIIAVKPWLSEPALTPMPWKPTTITPDQPLKIAIMWHDNVVQPHPPIARALRTTSSRLQTIPNISIVDWKPSLHDEAWAIISSLYFTDGGAEDASAITSSGEPWRRLTTWIIKDNPCVKKLSMQKLQYWQEEREAYRKEYAKVWNDTATGRDETGGSRALLM